MCFFKTILPIYALIKPTMKVKITKTIKSKLRIMLGLDAKVKLESPNTLQRFEGKAKRIKDLRSK